MRTSAPARVEVAVIGAGPAGLAAALSLARLGLNVMVVAPAYDAKRAAADMRTTALLGPSVELLKNLGVWQLCAEQSAPLTGIRIVDDRGGLVRAPEVLFKASELGLHSFGANVANPTLNAALHAVAARTPRLEWQPTASVTAVEPTGTCARLVLAEGASLTATLVVAADGRASIARAGAGISTRSWSYPQAAIATSFSHSRAHAGTSTELHRRAGPLTTVPLPGSASSLVWVEEPEMAQRLAALPERAFAAMLEDSLHGLLGSISELAPRALYPLSAMSAGRMGERRVALVGEAAHVIPPIGAQGLNLGLRDAAALAECVADAHERSEDIGGATTLATYHSLRSADVLSRTFAVDLLNRSLLTDLLPAQALRGLGLHLLANIAPLRRLAMQGGMAGPGTLPRLMQPDAQR